MYPVSGWLGIMAQIGGLARVGIPWRHALDAPHGGVRATRLRHSPRCVPFLDGAPPPTPPRTTHPANCRSIPPESLRYLSVVSPYTHRRFKFEPSVSVGRDNGETTERLQWLPQQVLGAAPASSER